MVQVGCRKKPWNKKRKNVRLNDMYGRKYTVYYTICGYENRCTNDQ